MKIKFEVLLRYQVSCGLKRANSFEATPSESDYPKIKLQRESCARKCVDFVLSPRFIKSIGLNWFAGTCAPTRLEKQMFAKQSLKLWSVLVLLHRLSSSIHSRRLDSKDCHLLFSYFAFGTPQSIIFRQQHTFHLPTPPPSLTLTNIVCFVCQDVQREGAAAAYHGIESSLSL